MLWSVSVELLGSVAMWGDLGQFFNFYNISMQV